MKKSDEELKHRSLRSGVKAGVDADAGQGEPDPGSTSTYVPPSAGGMFTRPSGPPDIPSAKPWGVP
jgi:hypothetical protein